MTRYVSILVGIVYVFAQLLGSIIGASYVVASLFVLMVINGNYNNSLVLGIGGRTKANLGAFQLAHDDMMWQGFLLEIILTFVLLTAVFGAGVKPMHLRDTKFDKMSPLVASFVVAMAVGACACCGTLTGACMNPARAFGPELIAWSWKSYSWIYYAAPLIGGLTATVLFEFIMTPRSTIVREKHHYEHL